MGKYCQENMVLCAFPLEVFVSVTSVTRCFAPGPASRNQLWKIPDCPNCTHKQCLLLNSPDCPHQKNHRWSSAENVGFTLPEHNPTREIFLLFCTGRTSALLLCLAGRDRAKPISPGAEENKTCLKNSWKKRVNKFGLFRWGGEKSKQGTYFKGKEGFPAKMENRT